MFREEVVRGAVAVSFAAIVGCGGQATGTGTHVDTGRDGAPGGTTGSGGDSSSGGGSTSSGGSSSGLVACNDGTGNTDCCPSSAVEGGTCDGSIPKCSRGGCHAGFTSYLYCGGSTWTAGKGLFPCSLDAGTAASFDAGPCRRATPPVCSQNTYPPCAPDWASALSWFTACGFPASGASVARCGSYNALVTSGFDNGNTYFYDAAGKLIGSQNSYSCEVYDPTFVPLAPLALNSCSPLHPCSGDAGTLPCGSQACATNQVCVQQKCGGGPNPCVPLPDAGTCPSGWTFDATCPRSTFGGCDPPPCTNPPPYCADVPTACLPLVTVLGALCPCADSVCQFGGCVEMFGRNVTCAAQ